MIQPIRAQSQRSSTNKGGPVYLEVLEVVWSILVEVDSSGTSSHVLSRPEFVIHLPLIFHSQPSLLPAFSSGYNQRIEYQWYVMLHHYHRSSLSATETHIPRETQTITKISNSGRVFLQSCPFYLRNTRYRDITHICLTALSVVTTININYVQIVFIHDYISYMSSSMMNNEE